MFSQALPQLEIQRKRFQSDSKNIKLTIKDTLGQLTSVSLTELRSINKPDSHVEDIIVAVIMLRELNFIRNSKKFFRFFFKNWSSLGQNLCHCSIRTMTKILSKGRPVLEKKSEEFLRTVRMLHPKAACQSCYVE